MNSLINRLPEPNARKKFLDFSHLSDDRQLVYLHFLNQDPVPVAKKLHDGTKIVPQTGVYENLFEAIIEQESDHSVIILNQILLKEVELFNQQLLESTESYFNDEIEKLEKLYNKYLPLNVFNVSISKWNQNLFPQIDDLLMNKILRSNNTAYARVLEVRNNFIELQDARIRSLDYQKLIEQFVANVDFDNKGLKLVQKLFEENLTFNLSLELPSADPKKILSMLFQRFDYDNKDSEYKIRHFSSIQEMVDAANNPST